MLTCYMESNITEDIKRTNDGVLGPSSHVGVSSTDSVLSNKHSTKKSKSETLPTCIATGKSLWASGGKKTSTAFFWNGEFPVGGVPT